MNEAIFPEYSIEYISNVMNLRNPQVESLQILDDILGDEILPPNNLELMESSIHNRYPVFQSFEHRFISMTFAIATGVGKTRLMGAFITYLYAHKGIKNFLVIAPNLTIYNKLKNDLGNPSDDNEKYVFKGLDCFFHNQPNVWTDDDYRTRPINSLIDNDSINIYIYNISKFNSNDPENRRMNRTNEYIGESFIDFLKNLEDLVLIMDESHHYRAEQSAQAINNLNPVLGLELTATPQVERNGRPQFFRNVVYEYSLARAITEGYTRTPYALTRRDFNAYNLDDDNLDMAMINDGINHHEFIKKELIKYAVNTDHKCIKPFALIVCKNTEHAEKVKTYICSDEFRNGYYKDKTITVHSNQRGVEADENIKLLLDVEKPDNKIEIVIHVNKLKEGWDVNNLYTIIPLRTATSRTLREQTIGRGLRLPYGSRTGNKFIDSVTITAHDKFEEIIREAQDPTSIFKSDKIVYAEDENDKNIIATQLSLPILDEFKQQIFVEAGYEPNDYFDYAEDFNTAKRLISNKVTEMIKASPERTISNDEIKDALTQCDIGTAYENNENIQRFVDAMFNVENLDIVEKVQELQMFIPLIKTERVGNESYAINYFILDCTNIDFNPIRNEILYRNIVDTSDDVYVTEARVLTQGRTMNAINIIIDGLRIVPEIDYEKCADVIRDVVQQYITYLRRKFGGNEEDVVNVCIMYKNAIVNEIKNQLLQNLVISYDGLIDEVIGIETIDYNQVIDYSGDIKNLYAEPGGEIKSVIYEGASKSVTDYFKFDSNPERIFAISCENSPEVIRWLRPSPRQFNITYNGGRRYEPDFVVETGDCYYLVEVKSTRELYQPDVLAKKERGIQYCRVASAYNIAMGHKPFKYLFIPHDEIHYESSFNNLKDRFVETAEE